MADLYLHRRKVNSIFQLLGEHENDITYSMAWAFAQSPSFLQTFLQKVVGHEAKTDEVLIRLQQYERDRGITDIEIESPGEFYIIVEAKRGWNLPDCKQLETYANRKSFKVSNAPFKRLVVLSECRRDYAERHLEIREIAGVQVEPISWKDVTMLASKARPEGSHAEKRLIGELLTYMGGIMTMQNIDSNWVYVVALASGTPPGWSISLIDIVRQRHHYFHPVGGRGWPKEPPNYIAFRYHGKLQSIYHIDDYEVITNLHKRIHEIPSEEWEPHFLYTLGSPFGPSKEVRTGKIYPNGRVWCMLDTLFTCDTISDARDLSQKRKSQVD